MAPMMITVAYCRVSTAEQARSGYSIADQEEALRAWCAENEHELLEVVKDEGHSGAYLERPGLDRVRDLVEEGRVSLVVAQDADRISREAHHRMLLDDEFERHGCNLVALDDWGDESHEGQLLRFLKGWVSKGERLKIAERTRRGRRQKTKQGCSSLLRPSLSASGSTGRGTDTWWTRTRCLSFGGYSSRSQTVRACTGSSAPSRGKGCPRPPAAQPGVARPCASS